MILQLSLPRTEIVEGGHSREPCATARPAPEANRLPLLDSIAPARAALRGAMEGEDIGV